MVWWIKQTSYSLGINLPFSSQRWSFPGFCGSLAGSQLWPETSQLDKGERRKELKQSLVSLSLGFLGSAALSQSDCESDMMSLGHQKALRSFQAHCREGFWVNLLELDLFCLTKKWEFWLGWCHTPIILVLGSGRQKDLFKASYTASLELDETITKGEKKRASMWPKLWSL